MSSPQRSEDCKVDNEDVVLIKLKNNTIACYTIDEIVGLINNTDIDTFTIQEYNVKMLDIIRNLKHKYNTYVLRTKLLFPIERRSILLESPSSENPSAFRYMPHYDKRKNYWPTIANSIVIVPERYILDNLLVVINQWEKIRELYQTHNKTFSVSKYMQMYNNVNLDTGINFVWYTYQLKNPDMFKGRLQAEKGAYQGMHRNIRAYIGYYTFYYDIDISSCHPSLAVQYLRKNADISNYPTLVDYVENRSKYFELLAAPPLNLSRNQAKLLMLKVFNTGVVKDGMKLDAAYLTEPDDLIIEHPPQFLRDLYNECVHAQNMIVKQHPEWFRSYIEYEIASGKFKKMEYDNVLRNPWLVTKARRHCWQRMLHQTENMCLFHMYNTFFELGYVPASLIFDGLGVVKHPDLDPDNPRHVEILTQVSDIIFNKCGYRIKLEIKGAPPALAGLDELLSDQMRFEEQAEAYERNAIEDEASSMIGDVRRSVSEGSAAASGNVSQLEVRRSYSDVVKQK